MPQMSHVLRVSAIGMLTAGMSIRALLPELMKLWVYTTEEATDNKHIWILSMAIWMHRDTVTRSWGPFSCHSSTTITSCFSMIIQGPMLQGSVHNSWKLKMSQFLHGLHTHQTIEHVWDALYWRVRQRVPVPANIQQLHTAIDEEWDNIPQATINSLINSTRRRCVAMHCFWIHAPTFFKLRCLWPTDAYLYSQSCEVHRLGFNEFISIDWFPYINCNSVKSWKLLHFVFIFLFSVVCEARQMIR